MPSGSSSLTLPVPSGLPALRVVLGDDALGRDNEVVLAEPRPQVVAVQNALPEGRGRTALIGALNAVAGVITAESGHLAFVTHPHLVAKEVEKFVCAKCCRLIAVPAHAMFNSEFQVLKRLCVQPSLMLPHDCSFLVKKNECRENSHFQLAFQWAIGPAAE